MSDQSVFAETQNRIKAERLVAAVVRAFYTDDFIIVVDALIRDSCIPEEEIAPRLKLPKSVIQPVIAQLAADYLISKETVALPQKGGLISYVYIDYQHCVDVIRYRLHLIRKYLKKQENKSYEQDKLRCLTCYREYTQLDALAMQCKDGLFACSYCCPYQEEFRHIITEKSFRLEPIDATHKLDNIAELQKKFDQQMKGYRGAMGERMSIDDLLMELKDKDLPRNLPSENIEHGAVTHNLSGLTQRQRDAIIHNYANAAKEKGTGTGSTLRKKHVDRLVSGEGKEENKEEEIDIEIFDSNEQAQEYAGSSSLLHNTAVSLTGVLSKDREEATLPDFLRHSHVAGADEIMKKVDEIQARRIGRDEEDGDVENASKRVKIEEPTVEANIDDIQWEAAPDDEVIVEIDDNMEWES